MIQYPAFKFDFLTPEDYNLNSVATLPEFQRIAARIQEAARRRVMIVPGAGIGVLSGSANSRKLEDFVWGTVVYPQISKRARDLLENEGVGLMTAEPAIRCRGRLIDTHLAIQAEPATLLTEESLRKHGLTHCKACGYFKWPLRMPTLPGGYELIRERWPDSQHLVKLVEARGILASEQFMEAVRRHELKGIRFEECGYFV